MNCVRERGRERGLNVVLCVCELESEREIHSNFGWPCMSVAERVRKREREKERKRGSKAYTHCWRIFVMGACVRKKEIETECFL